MNYIDSIAIDIGKLCGIQGVDADINGMRLLRIYAVLALTVGEGVTWEHVHDAWAAWRSDTDPRHTSLVPFNQLAPNVQALDAKYADAIREVARALKPIPASGQAAPAFDHSARRAKHFDLLLGFCACAHCAKLPEHNDAVEES